MPVEKDSRLEVTSVFRVGMNDMCILPEVLEEQEQWPFPSFLLILCSVMFFFPPQT